MITANVPSFDPKQVPIVNTHDSLPPVLEERLRPQAIQKRFLSSPKWQPEIRVEPLISDRSAQQAAVLIGIVDRPQPTVLLTQRTATLSTHAGQIAFPGGKVDPTDADCVSAALRETFEEVGLASSWITVLGQLPVYTTGTNFLVTPIVALIRQGFTASPNRAEVQEVFEVPLAYLMNPQAHRLHQWVWNGHQRHWYSMPYYERGQNGLQERYIWGATAGMLRNLYHFLSASDAISRSGEP